MTSRFSILVYGLKGWIGSQFKQILAEKNLSFIGGKSRVDNMDTFLYKSSYLSPIKTLFVTGGAGFIGSNFINYFAKKTHLFPL